MQYFSTSICSLSNHHFVFDDLKRTAKAEGWAVPADCATWEEALSQDSTTQQAKRLVDSFEQPVEVFGAKTKLSHEAARLAVKQYAQRNERMHSESIDKDLEDLPTILPAANLGSQEPAWREIIAYYGNECFGTQDAVSAVGEDSTDEPGKETSSDESVEEASTSQEDVDTTIPLGDLALGNSYDDDDNIQLGGGTLPKHGAATPHPDEPFPKNAKVNDESLDAADCLESVSAYHNWNRFVAGGGRHGQTVWYNSIGKDDDMFATCRQDEER
ncbi:uncharacterized protein L3040_007570 [Drepanopeziza brunnea f. sp. 'multigermtubi']|uniref:uncharacterized protein n=1 Tax=Drepanopeziza brunnea f. sp. 'multigermtubi' TaxID=698441 RepID=UPI00239DD1AD|nr:hypothetical protein L3040_007570 [Drepanopeziza brunnea f. sp. 'multigermtubi']